MSRVRAVWKSVPEHVNVHREIEAMASVFEKACESAFSLPKPAGVGGLGQNGTGS